MSITGPTVKDPEAVLEYTVDWDDLALESGETISTSAWAVSPAESPGLEVASSPSPSNTDGTATAWVTGGVVGHVYRLVNTITTSLGRTYEQSIVIRVEHQ